MQMLTNREANKLLLPLGLQIGDWQELADNVSEKLAYKQYRPMRDSLELFVAAKQLLDWISSDGWVFFQVDNSTAPTGDETAIFEKLVMKIGQHWDIGEQRSFLFNDPLQSCEDQTTLVLLIFFSLLFEWHVYLTSENLAIGQRLGLQDGTVYFYGNKTVIASANTLIDRLEENPLRFS